MLGIRLRVNLRGAQFSTGTFSPYCQTQQSRCQAAYTKDQNPTTFIASAQHPSSPSAQFLPLHFFHLLLRSKQVLKHSTWKKKRRGNLKKKKKEEKKPFLKFYPLSLPLYNPLSGFSSKSNLAHVSILTTPPLPLSLTPHLSLFLFSPHPFLLPLLYPSFPRSFVVLPTPPHAFVVPPSHSSPLPLPLVHPSISWWQHERLPVHW